MSAVNYSIPDEARVAFNDAFTGETKSAVIVRREQRVSKWSEAQISQSRQATRT